jgi:hypothetical protein
MERSSIPRPLVREVLLEAGHRCAIPTCRHAPVEIAHIVPWRDVQEHEFDNLITLCPTCHARYDKGDIDRLSMYRYKANLSILNSRYGDLERRVLQYFADHLGSNEITLFGGLDVLLFYLLRDKLIVDTGERDGVGFGAGADGDQVWSHVTYQLTEKGRTFIEKWMGPSDLEEG